MNPLESQRPAASDDVGLSTKQIEFNSSLAQAVRSASGALVAQQRPDGAWVGEVGLNPGPTSQAVMLHEALRLEFPAKLKPKAVRYIQRTQNADGGWSPFFGAPSEVSLACEAYFALRLLGEPADSQSVKAAREFIAREGGLSKANPWTQLYAAILGIAPWDCIQKTPIEIMLLPKWSLVQLEDLSYWVKAITIPMALLAELGPGRPIALAPTLIQELKVDRADWLASQPPGWLARLFPVLVKGLKRLPLNREKAVARAWDYISSITERHGDFGGNTCTAINVLVCMDRAGRRQDPLFQMGLNVFMNYAIEDETEWRLQTCQSHVWDTGFALCALPVASKTESAGDTVKAKNAFTTGAAWLKERQIRDVRGDWSRNVKALPGGWCFGNHHDHFPVTDCTALALLGLAQAEPEQKSAEWNLRAVKWLCGMQHSAGGWSAYEKYERGAWLNKVVKFKDLENALVDVPKADVSSKVLEALCHWRDLHAGVEDVLKRGREFLLQSRTEEGLWRGNYGVNTIYGTAFSVKALRKIDGRARDEWAKPVRDFYLPRQNADGGWGEVEASYRDASLYGRGPSSAVQTAWAILMMVACDDGSPRIRQAIEAATRYLLRTQKANGDWPEDLFLGTVFPGMVYFHYQFYSLYFPLMALNAVAALPS